MSMVISPLNSTRRTTWRLMKCDGCPSAYSRSGLDLRFLDLKRPSHCRPHPRGDLLGHLNLVPQQALQQFVRAHTPAYLRQVVDYCACVTDEWANRVDHDDVVKGREVFAVITDICRRRVGMKWQISSAVKSGGFVQATATLPPGAPQRTRGEGSCQTEASWVCKQHPGECAAVAAHVSRVASDPSARRLRRRVERVSPSRESASRRSVPRSAVNNHGNVRVSRGDHHDARCAWRKSRPGSAHQVPLPSDGVVRAYDSFANAIKEAALEVILVNA
jgi:hypothetical protein